MNGMYNETDSRPPPAGGAGRMQRSLRAMGGRYERLQEARRTAAGHAERLQEDGGAAVVATILTSATTIKRRLRSENI